MKEIAGGLPWFIHAFPSSASSSSSQATSIVSLIASLTLAALNGQTNLERQKNALAWIVMKCNTLLSPSSTAVKSALAACIAILCPPPPSASSPDSAAAAASSSSSMTMKDKLALRKKQMKEKVPMLCFVLLV